MARKPSRYKPPVLKRFRTRERRYPIWSVRWVVAVGLLGFALTAGLVLLMGPGRLITRLEVTLAVVAGALFLFLTVGLYSGARVRKREDVAGELKTIRVPDGLGDLGTSGLDAAGSADDGCLGLVLALLALILLPFLIVLLFVLVANVGLILFFLVALATGWLFHRALRQVFARSRRCRGDLATSLLYAGWYTLLYTGWLFAVLVLVDRLNQARGA